VELEEQSRRILKGKRLFGFFVWFLDFWGKFLDFYGIDVDTTAPLDVFYGDGELEQSRAGAGTGG
jgi:hypothetical protein